MANMLYAYGARVRTNLRKLAGEAFFGTSTRVKDILKPGEFVTEIIVPKPQDGIVEDISLVLGAVAPVPMKMTEAEDFLKGKVLTEETAREAAEIALRHAIPLEMNGYKIDMAKVMIRRFLGF